MFGFHIVSISRTFIMSQMVMCVCVFKNYETEIQESDPNDNPAGMNSSGKAHLEMCFEI